MTVGKRNQASSSFLARKRIFASLACAALLSAFAFGQNAKSASYLFEEGKNFQDERDWWNASEKYQEALKANPSYADAWFRLAQCVYQMNQSEAALEYLQSAKKYAPGRSDMLNLEGMAMISLGRLDEAQKIFEGIQKKYPNDIDSRFGLAELNLFKGRVSGAESLYSDALKRNPGSSKALLSLALISAELGKDKQAETFVNQAIQSHAENPQAHYVASYLSLKKGDAAAAEKRCLAAIQVDSNYWKAYELLSLIYFAQGRYNDVIDLSDMMISRDRNNGRAWFIKGLSLERLGQKTKAIDIWSRGLDAVPQDEVMRAAFELLVFDDIDIEDARRKTWAKHHVQKGADYAKKFAGPQMRYEYQAALRLDPANYAARSAFSRLLRAEGFSENFLSQIKFIQENEILKSGIEEAKKNGKKIDADDEKIAYTRLSDTVEGYECLLQDTLASKWDVNPFFLDKTRWTIGFYCLPANGTSAHPELSNIAAKHLSLMFRGILGTSARIAVSDAPSFGAAYADAHKNGYDYFVLFSAAESERDIKFSADVYSARTGTETQKFAVYKTGNNRYAAALLSLRQGILDILPVRAKLLERSGNDVLVDIGKTEGMVKGAKFAVIARGALKTADSGKGLRFEKDALLGTVELVKVGEEISEGVLSGTGFYDRVNPRDELLLLEMPKDDSDASKTAQDTSPAADQNGRPLDGSPIEAAAEDPLRGAAAKAERTPELLEMIRGLY
jgi:tetratricopeptide (TPR) repeat protein